MKTKTRIDSLHSGFPTPVIEAAFIIMVLAAICSYGALQSWLYQRIPVLLGLLNTVGMVTLYLAILRGMKPLPHPLTVLWWIAIGVNLLDFVVYCLGDAAHGIAAASAAALPLVYLPLGILIYIWYQGRLGQVGLWMVLRILIINLVPVLFYVAGLLDHPWALLTMEIITIAAELWYAWVLRRVLK
jgi:hypothetical protein